MSYQPPSLPAPGGPLTRQQKAAVVVHLLVSGGADPGLRDLPAHQQRKIVNDMAMLRFIDRETLADVVTEFASELDSVGLHFPTDRAKVLEMLEQQLSIDVVESLTTELDPENLSGPWEKIAALDPDRLMMLLDGESEEVSAILLSKLPSSLAATLMADLPTERAEAIAAAFGRTESISPSAVTRIGIALGRETARAKTPAFATGSVLRVASILNAATSSVRTAILDSLDQTDPDFARRVRLNVFSFENIPDRIQPRDLPKVLRAVPQPTLVTALAGSMASQQQVCDWILGAISQRMAGQIRDEIDELDATPTLDETEAATGAIVTNIREMEEQGELTLSAPPD